MRATRVWRNVALGIVAAVALAAGIYAGKQALAPEGAADAGPLLAVTLPDLDGKPQSVGQWRGRVLVVNFWATWCAPCREEMPEFVKAQRDYGVRGLQFVGIATDDEPKVRQFAAEIGVNYPTLLGGYGAIELSRTLGNRVGALPFTVILDREGRVVHRQLGPLKPSQLRALIDTLL
jgi:thiol-disulfide isomerase/thioredoxin